MHERYWSDDLLAALTAERLTRLDCRTAPIAEHESLPKLFRPVASLQNTYNS
jgi:hypothetical protein